ncbi:MAG: PAAR-like domain-containing protein [Planctomycetaceae bacterium]
MAINEGTRMDGQFLVISLVPDVCKSPVVPVPYPIVGYLNQSILVSPNVRARGVPIFHMGSRVATVVGDESGVGGGVMSQVFKGMCRPVVPVPTVRINGQMHTYHQQTLMLMNCAGPEGPANTLGHVKFIAPMYNADVGPGGTIPADSDPPAKAESIAEGGCMSKLDGLLGADGGGFGDIVGMAQTAYSLATTDWSNPGAVLGAIGGIAGMAGLGSLAQAANLAQGAVGLATADWSNPGAALGAAMGVAGPMLGGMMGGGGSASKPGGMDVIPGIGGDIPIARPKTGHGGSKFPPGVVPCF